jgi:hypothetical protein
MLQFRLARPRGATGREVWNRVSLAPVGERVGVRGHPAEARTCPHPSPLPEGEGAYADGVGVGQAASKGM